MLRPNNFIREGIQEYVSQIGLPPVVEGHYVQVDRPRAEAIAAAYQMLPVLDDQAREAYRQLSKEILEQYIFAWLHMDIDFRPWEEEGQPYPNSAALFWDVHENRRVYYFTGGESHPFLGRQINNVFRAIHDLFGHAAEGYSFGPRGEENAWLHHSQMFSPLAQRALTTETRGQNNWVNWWNDHPSLPPSLRPYAVQKAALLPKWISDFRGLLVSQPKEELSDVR